MNDSTGLAEPTLLPGQSAPLTVITSTDQGGVVLIATALAWIFALLSVILRIFVRREFRHQFSGDDVAALFSMGLMTIHSSLLFASVSHGFGKAGGDISDADNVLWQKDSYIGEIFYILTLWSTKLSVTFLFLQLSPYKGHKRASHVFIGVSAGLVTISVLISALRCDISQPWLYVGVYCPGLFARWQIIVSFDIFSEVTLFLTSVYLVQGLQLAWGKKMVVIFAFGLRLPVIVPAILRLYYEGIEVANTNPSLDGIMAVVCTEVELCYAVVATTIPCLRPFMSALSTNYGGPTQATTPPGNTIEKGYNITMTPLPTTSKVGTRNAPDNNQPTPATRWDGAGYNVNVVTGDHESVTSNDSRRMIISKNTEWTVDYGTPSPDKNALLYA